ncbi:MAG: SPOR domain-containing protein [Flavobacteriaceae bacterium]
MNVAYYLRELLYQYECVSIPDFGAFVTRSFPTQIDYQKGIFHPQRRELTFNPLLKSNDGVLAHYMAQKLNMSYEGALRDIEKEVIVWKQKLQTQALVFGNLGEMRLNAIKKIEFLPYGKINYDKQAFGLRTFTRTPLVAEPKETEPLKIFSMMEDNNENFMFTPDQNDASSGGSSVLRYAVIGILGVALAGGGYYFGDQYLQSERAKNQEMAQKRIQANVEKATFELGSLSKIELNLTATAAEVEEETTESEAVALDQTYYSIIAGTYREMANAERKLEDLKSQGYSAAFAEVNPEGLHRVAYGRYASKKEALNLLYYIKYTLEEEAWYLIESNE